MEGEFGGDDDEHTDAEEAKGDPPRPEGQGGTGSRGLVSFDLGDGNRPRRVLAVVGQGDVEAPAPGVDLMGERVDRLSVCGLQAVDGQPQLALVALDRPDAATDVGGDVLPPGEGS